MRMLTPEPEKLYTWWSYRATDNWRAADAAAGSTTSGLRTRSPGSVSTIDIAKSYRGAKRPSDHVPVTATIQV